MSNLEKEIAKAQKIVNDVLGIPVEVLKSIQEEDPELVASALAVIEKALANKNR